MGPKEKLKLFMGAKARRLWLLGVKDWHLYYTPEDAQDINSWDEATADEVWETIVDSVLYEQTSGLSPCTCPFCIKYRNCDTCSYAKRHFRCIDHYSDFARIAKLERGLSLFPNSWYWQVVFYAGRQ